MPELGNDSTRTKGNSPLAHWFHQAVGLDGARVQFRLRGNNLHILCEDEPCPDQTTTLTRLVLALQTVHINSLVPANQPPIYQIFLYGRRPGQPRPDWTAPIDLNQLDRHLEQLNQTRVGLSEFEASRPLVSAVSLTSEPSTSTKAPPATHSTPPHSRVTPPAAPPRHPAKPPATPSTAALKQSNLSLARQGKTEAIARHLSDSLSSLGVAVQVSVKTLPCATPESGMHGVVASSPASDPTLKRLWVICEATYSPDPSLLSEAIAQRVRSLELEGFRDAIVLVQVAGEAEPDWVLRVDLTPPDDMLREWGRWGDVQAITRLLDQALKPLKLVISTASLRDATLHLFCSAKPQAGSSPRGIVPEQGAIVPMLEPLLEAIAPQGIHAAMLYGQVVGQETPAWVHWLDLPASQHPALAETPLDLARQADWGATAYLLNRLLNPNLDHQLATGGIRIQLLPKNGMLHVMSDAPVCPDQKQVGEAVVRFLKELKLPGVKGVRVYGRRSGQKRPLWSYGEDVSNRPRLVPEPTPEFAATDAYIGDLIGTPGELALRPDLTPADIHTVWTRWRDRTFYQIQQLLIRSSLFRSNDDVPDAEPANDVRDLKLALVWGAVGVLLAVQIDWGLGRLLRSPEPLASVSPSSLTSSAAQALPQPPSSPPVASSPTSDPPTVDELPLPDLTLRQTPDNEDDTDVFNHDGFTGPGESLVTPTPSLTQQDASPQAGRSPTTGPQSPSPSNADQTRLPAPEALPYTPTDPLRQQVAASILTSDLPYPTFNSKQLDEKLAIYYERLRQSGTPDVLIVGSSRALRGIDPVALERSLTSLGYTDIDIFNFGINGATVQVVDLLLRQILRPEQLPKLIIWADGARAFNSGTVDVTYNGIVVSKGYRDLISGNLDLDVPGMEPGTAADQAEASSGQGGIGASLSNSYQAIDRWLSTQLGHVSTVFAERDRLKTELKDQFGLLSASATPPNPTTEPPDPIQSLSAGGRDMIDFDGFLPISLKFNPATYFQEYARVEGRYDIDYEDFRIEGMQASALQSLITFTRDRNIPLVLVNLPLTQDYLDPVRLEHEQTYKQFLFRQALSQPGFIVRDLSDIWLQEHDYFSDPSHLNRYGAYELSRRLAQDPMIPWDAATPSPTAAISQSE